MSSIILPAKFKRTNPDVVSNAAADIIQGLDEHKPTMVELLYTDYCPTYPTWRQRSLTIGLTRYTKWTTPFTVDDPERSERTIIYRVEMDPEPESGKALVALLRHRPQDPQTRMHIPWDLLLYETYELESVRDARAQAICADLPSFNIKSLQVIHHPESAL